jgi:hypothetical protein
MNKGTVNMDNIWKTIIWQQFGAAIDMIENAVRACPEDLWGDRSQKPEFWYTVFHTLFFIDLYLSPSDKGFVPPAPFTLDELDEAGILPERVYTKEELLRYLDHGRQKCRTVIGSLTDDTLHQRCGFDWLDITVAESVLYNLRHVQHHAGQLNMVLSQKTGSAPRWVRKTQHRLGH